MLSLKRRPPTFPSLETASEQNFLSHQQIIVFQINNLTKKYQFNLNRFVVELNPTGDVTEYTATVAYELLKEGEEGRQKVDSVKFILRAEGSVQCRKIFPSHC